MAYFRRYPLLAHEAQQDINEVVEWRTNWLRGMAIKLFICGAAGVAIGFAADKVDSHQAASHDVITVTKQNTQIDEDDKIAYIGLATEGLSVLLYGATVTTELVMKEKEARQLISYAGSDRTESLS